MMSNRIRVFGAPIVTREGRDNKHEPSPAPAIATTAIPAKSQGYFRRFQRSSAPWGGRGSPLATDPHYGRHAPSMATKTKTARRKWELNRPLSRADRELLRALRMPYQGWEKSKSILKIE